MLSATRQCSLAADVNLGAPHRMTVDAQVRRVEAPWACAVITNPCCRSDVLEQTCHDPPLTDPCLAWALQHCESV